MLRWPSCEDAFREYQCSQRHGKQCDAKTLDSAGVPDEDEGDEEILDESQNHNEQNAVAPSPTIERAPQWILGLTEERFSPRRWVRFRHVAHIGTGKTRLNH